MPRKRKQWSTSTDMDLYIKFKDLSRITRINSTKLLDEAIEDLLSKFDYEALKKTEDKK